LRIWRRIVRWSDERTEVAVHAGPTRLPEDASQTMMEVDRALRLSNQERLRRLSRDAAAGARLVCARDPVVFERCAAGTRL